jgi:hypothetical protein
LPLRSILVTYRVIGPFTLAVHLIRWGPDVTKAFDAGVEVPEE